MWHGARDVLGARISKGLVIHPDNAVHEESDSSSIVFVAAPHPVPDHRSEDAAILALRFIAECEAPQSLLVLISGGASALLERPINGLSLGAFLDVIADLQKCGPSIHDLNYVRSCLSAVKGGRLVQDCRVPVETLVISDVADDCLGVIGSGPTIPFAPQPLPEAVANWLMCAHLSPDTEAAVHGPDLPSARSQDRARLAAPFDSAARAAERVCGEMGIHAEIVHPAFAGSVESVCERVTIHLREVKAAAVLLIFYGEATISLPREHGNGGRAQQLALELAKSLAGTPHHGLVAGTDGIDGNSEAAGAFFSGDSWSDVAGFDPEAALEQRDAGSLLRRAGLCLETGPTGVNHADLILVWVGQSRAGHAL